jgi:hypothetical protein
MGGFVPGINGLAIAFYRMGLLRRAAPRHDGCAYRHRERSEAILSGRKHCHHERSEVIPCTEGVGLLRHCVPRNDSPTVIASGAWRSLKRRVWDCFVTAFLAMTRAHTVIASGAWRSLKRRVRLLRHCVPRNDRGGASAS